MTLEEKRRGQLESIIDAHTRRFEKMLWIDEGGAASGEAWSEAGGHFFHILWTYPHVEFILKDKNARIVYRWSIEQGDPLWPSAQKLVDSMPCRAREIDVVLDELLHHLQSKKKI